MKRRMRAALAMAWLALLAVPLAAETAPPRPKCDGVRATIAGTLGDDNLVGTRHRDVIAGLAGNDRIEGLGGDDRICAGDGDDVLLGGAGKDRLFGESGSDTASFAVARGPVAASLATGSAAGEGNDRLAGIEHLTGSAHADALTGSAGDNVLSGGAGNDVLDGGPGTDRAGYAAAAAAVTVDLEAARSNGEGTDTLVSVEGALGSSHDDFLYGGPGADALDGGAGADLVMGFDGDDALAGGPGDDTLRGGAGTDSLDGGQDLDACVEGEILAGCDVGTGGTLRIEGRSRFDYADPALAFFSSSWQLGEATCLRLYRYAPQPLSAPAAPAVLEPDAATGMPVVSAGGLTYSFTIAPGFRFSPPSGEPVTAETFKSSFERALDPVMQSPAQLFLGDVAGVAEYIAGTASEISGIAADGSTLTITLVRPSGDLPAQLALTFFCALPIGTPRDPFGLPAPVPSAGPYYLTSFTGLGATAVRNPSYRGPRASHFDAIEWVFGNTLEAALANVEAGASDMGSGLPASEVERLYAAYGPGSPAAAAGRQRLFLVPNAVFWYLALNAERVFADERLRRAVAYALDRTALAALHGPRAGTPTDQILPPALPGYVDRDVFPLTPDLAAATALAASAGVTPATPITVEMYTFNNQFGPAAAAAVQASLAPLGIDVHIQTFDRVVHHEKTTTRGEPFDITLTGWGADYLDPFNFLDPLLNGARIRATGNLNVSYFDDPVYNARLDAAALLPAGPARWAAYAELDRDLSAAAPVIPYVNTNARLFYSDRIGCHAVSPGMTALNELCLR